MKVDSAPPDPRPARAATAAAGPPLLCVSGLGGRTDDWADVGRRLSRHGQVIAVELVLRAPDATRPAGGPLTTAVDALGRVVAGQSGRPVLIGHSMGALAGLLIASTQPQRLAGIVLTAPFVPAGRHGRSSLATAVDYAGHRALYLAGARARRRRRSGMPAIDRAGRAAALGALAAYGLRPAAFHAMADQASCPVLLVHGGDDHYVPPAFALAAAARHPAWQIALIPGAGHFPHRDDPAAWLGAVEPWLRRLRPILELPAPGDLTPG